MEEGVTIAEAARVLGVSEWAVRRRLKAGKLRGQLVGREWRIHLAAELADTQDASESPPTASTVTLDALAEALAAATERADDERRRVAELEQERAELFGRLGFYQARVQVLEETVKALQAPAAARANGAGEATTETIHATTSEPPQRPPDASTSAAPVEAPQPTADHAITARRPWWRALWKWGGQPA